MSSCTAASLNLRPMRRLASNTVFVGFMATLGCRGRFGGRVLQGRGIPSKHVRFVRPTPHDVCACDAYSSALHTA